MRKEKRRIRGAPRLIAIIALAAITPVLFNLARLNMEALGDVSERAAILSAAINMPDGGIGLIKERFRTELEGEKPAEGLPAEKTPENREHPGVENEAPVTEKIPDEPDAKDTNPEKKEAAVRPPRIPAKYSAELISENFAGRPDGSLIQWGDAFIKNDTKKMPEQIEELLEEGFDLGFTGGLEPQVLIFHTHATESFEKYDNTVYDTRNTWRSTDNNNNMAAVGAAMQEVLEENGIGVIHDTTQHDYPSYNGSYERSAKTVTEYLEEYPTIKVVLDLHRDAMERENQAIVKPVATINGKKAAQLMIIVGCDDGTMNMPNWPKNLRFAAAFQDLMARRYKDLTRPIYFCYRKYNMDLSDGSLLLEFGSNANTLDEAVYSAQLAGQALADLIKENITDE